MWFSEARGQGTPSLVAPPVSAIPRIHHSLREGDRNYNAVELPGKNVALPLNRLVSSVITRCSNAWLNCSHLFRMVCCVLVICNSRLVVYSVHSWVIMTLVYMSIVHSSLLIKIARWSSLKDIITTLARRGGPSSRELPGFRD